ncbi:MAG: N-formylglutamate amidohydrolase [Pseudomonadota bacterium]
MFDEDQTLADHPAGALAAECPERQRWVERYHLDGRAPCLLVCDHAGRQMPEHLHGLGLPEHELNRHIGWDIGAADVTRRLAILLDAPAILCHSSRLLIDPNRQPGGPGSIPEISDGTFVPGNQNLAASEQRERLRRYFVPYHRAIARQIGVLRRRVGTCAIISIHSFTPIMQRGWRPWEVAVLWDGDDRLAAPVLENLRRDAELRVGDNEPYSGGYPVGYTIPFHARRTGLPHVTFELRQDQIDTTPRAVAWAERLAEALRPSLDDPALYRLWKDRGPPCR